VYAGRVGGASFRFEAKEPRNPAMLCGRGAAALELGRKDEAKRPSSDGSDGLAALLPLAAATRQRRISGRLWPVTPHLEVQSTP